MRVTEPKSPRREALPVLGLYAVLHLFPFVWSAVTWDDYSSSLAPYATLLALGVLVALLLGHRWAWVVLVAVNALIILSYLSDPADALALVMTVLRLALLLSPPVRRFVWDGNHKTGD